MGKIPGAMDGLSSDQIENSGALNGSGAGGQNDSQDNDILSKIHSMINKYGSNPERRENVAALRK